jgi:hypothetical protein
VSGVTRWELFVKDADPETAPMNVVSHGFAAKGESFV